MTRSYRLERWITAILFTIFIIPFVAEAESFYIATIAKRNAHNEQPRDGHPTAALAVPASCPLPEDAVENPIDRDPTEAELDGDDCC